MEFKKPFFRKRYEVIAKDKNGKIEFYRGYKDKNHLINKKIKRVKAPYNYEIYNKMRIDSEIGGGFWKSLTSGREKDNQSYVRVAIGRGDENVYWFKLQDAPSENEIKFLSYFDDKEITEISKTIFLR